MEPNSLPLDRVPDLQLSSNEQDAMWFPGPVHKRHSFHPSLPPLPYLRRWFWRKPATMLGGHSGSPVVRGSPTKTHHERESLPLLDPQVTAGLADIFLPVCGSEPRSQQCRWELLPLQMGMYLPVGGPVPVSVCLMREKSLLLVVLLKNKVIHTIYFCKTQGHIRRKQGCTKFIVLSDDLVELNLLIFLNRFIISM